MYCGPCLLYNIESIFPWNWNPCPLNNDLIASTIRSTRLCRVFHPIVVVVYLHCTRSETGAASPCFQGKWCSRRDAQQFCNLADVRATPDPTIVPWTTCNWVVSERTISRTVTSYSIYLIDRIISEDSIISTAKAFLCNWHWSKKELKTQYKFFKMW